jgi:uncharacterized protein (TIGR02001 family)
MAINRFLCCILGLASVFCCSILYAGQLGGTLAITSDYIYRGLSQTRGDPAIQGSIQYSTRDHWVVGVWASSVRLNAIDGTTVEVDPYIGFRWNFSDDWHGKLTAMRYFHPLESSTTHYEYDEVSASLDYNNTIFLNVAWSWDYARYSTWRYGKGTAISYEATWTTSLPRLFSLDAGVGYYDLSDLFNTGYWYWSAGVGKDWGKWHVAANYIGSNHEAERLFTAVPAGNRFAIMLLRRF